MRLNLAHGWDMPLGDLMVIFHIVLQGLIVVVLHLLAGYGAWLRAFELIGLVISLGHRDLVLGVECKLGVTSLHLCHEGRR